jgi:hypothetical protein
MLDGECVKCGTLITVPTPLDMPRRDKWKKLLCL